MLEVSDVCVFFSPTLLNWLLIKNLLLLYNNFHGHGFRICVFKSNGVSCG